MNIVNSYNNLRHTIGTYVAPQSTDGEMLLTSNTIPRSGGMSGLNKSTPLITQKNPEVYYDVEYSIYRNHFNIALKHKYIQDCKIKKDFQTFGIFQTGIYRGIKWLARRDGVIWVAEIFLEYEKCLPHNKKVMNEKSHGNLLIFSNYVSFICNHSTDFPSMFKSSAYSSVSSPEGRLKNIKEYLKTNYKSFEYVIDKITNIIDAYLDFEITTDNGGDNKKNEHNIWLPTKNTYGIYSYIYRMIFTHIKNYST